jgi:hypothetical protein
MTGGGGVSERSLAEALAALPAAERAQLEQRLSTASLAVWQARQALAAPHTAETRLSAWRAYLRRGRGALAAADAVMAPYEVKEEPAASR